MKSRLSRGDAVLIPVPFTDLSSRKRRPVLVLSAHRGDFICAAITSNIGVSKFSVVLTDKSMSSGKLPTASEVLCNKIYTLNESIVVKKFGKVKTEVVEETVGKLIELLKG